MRNILHTKIIANLIFIDQVFLLKYSLLFLKLRFLLFAKILNLDFISNIYFSTPPKITEDKFATRRVYRTVKQEKITREKEREKKRNVPRQE